MGFLSWMDGAAYTAWAGLRPYTELEFEKACRGTESPIPGEFAWGNNNIADAQYELLNSGANDEIINANYSTTSGNAAYNYTTGSIGPVRVGIFAGTSSNNGKETAGATFYGIMEMSGNLFERIVPVGDALGRTFTGLHGDGDLDGFGNANVTFWPGANDSSTGLRGGSWNYQNYLLNVSDRIYATSAGGYRYFERGGRGIRSAP